MLEDACVEIEVLTEKDRHERAQKYARRNRMRYIDQLLNELEMLNLAEQVKMPDRLSQAVDQLIEESRAAEAVRRLHAALFEAALEPVT